MRGALPGHVARRRALAFAISLCALAAIGAVVRARSVSLDERPALAAVAPAASRTFSPTADPGTSRQRLVSLGRALFADTSLSVPPGTSCASCHEPARAFAGNHGSSNGVALGSRPGHFAKRNTPSVLYLRFVRAFHLHWEEDAPLVDAYGGFFWDGRSDSLVELVRQPLFNPDEMNAGSPSTLAHAIGAGTHADDFRAVFGATALDDPDAALHDAGEALAAYLLAPEMAPFSSRYDDYVRGEAVLTEEEARGLALFKDSARGGCSACHKMDDRSPDPARSLFTDYGFDAVGVPRNRRLAATRDPSYFDLGLCEHAGPDYRDKTDEFCGRFRAPSLRNVAVRSSFMHNGAFSSLRDVVAFYATRATDPARWYGRGGTFDDLPAKYLDNVQIDKAPYNRRRGEKPPLDDRDVDAIVAFLRTLTDAPFR
jgi:cytochrome c peroxidase